jgi:Secretion system C-terminal sorting domain
MATSTDGGQSWFKYDDPLTTSPPSAESDPVVKVGPESFDYIYIFGAGITRSNNVWEMFYAGYISLTEGSICYASSLDGIHWTKYLGNPIYTFWEDPLAVYAIIETPTVVFHDSSYFLYYDYGNGDNSAGIGLATAPLVGIEPPAENKISDFTLYQNYPNPFNATTVISWLVSSPAQGSDGQLVRQNNSAGQAVGSMVRLSIYDISGREITVLVNGKQPAGRHQIEFDASDLASGIYLYRLQVGSFVESIKMILIR